MKVKEIKEAVVARKFEPFSFTIDVQTEEELIELFHRFYQPSGKLLQLYSNGIPPKWSFTTNKCTDVKDFLSSKMGYFDLEP